MCVELPYAIDPRFESTANKKPNDVFHTPAMRDDYSDYITKHDTPGLWSKNRGWDPSIVGVGTRVYDKASHNRFCVSIVVHLNAQP